MVQQVDSEQKALAEAGMDQSNSQFWNELCGSALARTLGITDSSAASLKRFDDWYFDFYPYLLPFVNAADLRGKRALEVGLGYGSLSQKMAEAGATYTGLDIAAGPVAMVNHRLHQQGLPGPGCSGQCAGVPVSGSLIRRRRRDRALCIIRGILYLLSKSCAVYSSRAGR